MALTEQASEKRGRFRITTRDAALGFVILGLIAFFGGYFWTDASELTFVEYIKDMVRQAYSNFGIEALSIAATVLVIESLGKRQAEAERKALEEQNRQQAEAERKKELILQMGSPNNEFAVEAVRLLVLKGWLRDGSLEGAHLGSANLPEAHLANANLQGANLGSANLQGASLWNTNLQGTHLGRANLQGARLSNANLQGARLSNANLQEAHLADANLQGVLLLGANLQEAHLADANLQGANLFEANLQGANLSAARFDEKTLLPDSTYWTAETDMRRFTGPEHPEFWRSDDDLSPAYRGDKTPPPSP